MRRNSTVLCHFIHYTKSGIKGENNTTTMEQNVQLTSHIGRPFINAWVFINTRRKCAASAFKRTVVFK